MGGKRNSGVISSTDEIKIVPAFDAAAVSADAATDLATDSSNESGETPAIQEPAKVKAKHVRQRSSKYRAVRAQIDKTKKYDSFAAIELVKKLSYTRFDGTLTAHAVVKEAGMSVPITFPHSTGKSLRVAIASDEVLAKIGEGHIDFDILVASPQFMPKLAKFAPVLGPKGLMPNPKNGTLTANPEAQKEKLEGGTLTIKTEKKAPLMHIRIGKTSMETKVLVENIEMLVKVLGSKLDRLTIASTMSPGVKIETTAVVV